MSHRLLWFTVLALLVGVPARAKDVMLMNRIGPSISELYAANVDGSGEHKVLPTDGFDYHATYSADGNWIVFTSERAGSGQADIYRARADGTSLERLTDDPALDDGSIWIMNPDGTGKRQLTESHWEDSMPCFASGVHMLPKSP